MAHLLGRSGSSGEVLLLHPGQILVVARVGNAERGPLVVVVVQGGHCSVSAVEAQQALCPPIGLDALPQYPYLASNSVLTLALKKAGLLTRPSFDDDFAAD